MESLTPTLEMCQKLKAAGYPQETLFCWSGNQVYQTRFDIRGAGDLAAPTAQELGDQLPDWDEKRKSSLTIDKIGQRWSGRYGLMSPSPLEAQAPTMVEALAQLYLALHTPEGGQSND